MNNQLNVDGHSAIGRFCHSLKGGTIFSNKWEDDILTCDTWLLCLPQRQRHWVQQLEGWHFDRVTWTTCPTVGKGIICQSLKGTLCQSLKLCFINHCDGDICQQVRGDFVNHWEDNMEYIVHGYFVRNSLTLEHNLWNVQCFDPSAMSLGNIQYANKTHSWWLKTLYISQIRLQSKWISIKTMREQFVNHWRGIFSKTVRVFSVSDNEDILLIDELKRGIFCDVRIRHKVDTKSCLTLLQCQPTAK